MIIFVDQDSLHKWTCSFWSNH